jgi:hypothetical protein
MGLKFYRFGKKLVQTSSLHQQVVDKLLNHNTCTYTGLLYCNLPHGHKEGHLKVVKGALRVGQFTEDSPPLYVRHIRCVFSMGRPHETDTDVEMYPQSSGKYTSCPSAEKRKRYGMTGSNITYKGGFRNNDFDGYGVMNFVWDWEEYRGSWVNGRPHGKGTWLFPRRGYMYEGDINEARITGRGRLTCISTQALIFQGMWENGRALPTETNDIYQI